MKLFLVCLAFICCLIEEHQVHGDPIPEPCNCDDSKSEERKTPGWPDRLMAPEEYPWERTTPWWRGTSSAPWSQERTEPQGYPGERSTPWWRGTSSAPWSQERTEPQGYPGERSTPWWRGTSRAPWSQERTEASPALPTNSCGACKSRTDTCPGCPDCALCCVGKSTVGVENKGDDNDVNIILDHCSGETVYVGNTGDNNDIIVSRVDAKVKSPPIDHGQPGKEGH